MRHTLVLKEAPPSSGRGSSFNSTTGKAVTVDFQYAVAQPVDALAEGIVRAFFSEDEAALKASLASFTSAGHNPSFIQVHGDFEDEPYKSFRPDNLRSLLTVALTTRKTRIALMKILVTGGCDPFAPLNFAAGAVSEEAGPSSKGRRKWTWLLDNTPPERWLDASCDVEGLGKRTISLVHLAVRKGHAVVVEAMIRRLGTRVLEAEGPPLFEWLDDSHPEKGSPAQRETRQALLDVMRPALVVLEQAELRAVMGGTEVAKAGARPRL